MKSCIVVWIIREIADIGKKIEESYDKKRARDREIAIKDQKIYVLQERPISAYSHIDKGQFRTIYDNSNIIESYSGVTTAISFFTLLLGLNFSFKNKLCKLF